MLFASPSSFFKQSSHIGIGAIIVNSHSIRTAIELRPPVSESSTKILKFHAPADSEHKFHKARIENWPPIEFKLGFPWLRIRRHNHQLGTRWVGVPLPGSEVQLLKLWKCSQIPLLASASWPTNTTQVLNSATLLAIKLSENFQTPGVTQGNLELTSPPSYLHYLD